jgi:hypothetical protein
MTYWQWVHFFMLWRNGPVAAMWKASYMSDPDRKHGVLLGPRWWQHWTVEAAAFLAGVVTALI